jgi:hypothetical protein
MFQWIICDWKNMQGKPIPEPWKSFLDDVDGLLKEELHLHCLGGFVIARVYGLERDTSDIDVLPVRQIDGSFLEACGKGSPLHKKHGVYLQSVGVVTLPYNYEDRLIPIAGGFQRLRLHALEPHDLALSKLERNSAIDLDDVRRMARKGILDPRILQQRFRDELRPYIANPYGREDTTLKQWLEWYFGQGDTPGQSDEHQTKD